VWLASDVHLGANTPATSEAFRDFLKLAASEADALLLPGDIFDAWIGDDVAVTAPTWLAQDLMALKLTASKIPVWLGRGNRDFLMGEALTAGLGAKLLTEQALIETTAGTILLSHGDEYCIDDVAYQQFRAMVRNPAWQAGFLAKSVAERLAMAAQARDESMTANQSKSSEIMDVNPEAINQALAAAGVSLMVHGHTHRPARHVFAVDAKPCERWVLPDWECDHVQPGESPRGGWLAIDQDGLSLYDLALDDGKND
jgi:UDP-2,3-diacylglucosamine hydrolase